MSDRASMIGAYGAWAASIARDPPRLSLRGEGEIELDAWRRKARARVEELLLTPPIKARLTAEVQHRFDYDGLHVEHLRWQLPYGPLTEAIFLKPRRAAGRLPAVLALHDHGGIKYFGWRKIAAISDDIHPMMRRHQANHYGGVAWANKLAARGYAVLVHDAFAFASRRVRGTDLPNSIPHPPDEVHPESETEIEGYNRWAAEHEHLMAKSLFCAGTTWPGVWMLEDRAALDYLASRPDVDPGRIGCAGLSGGGLRTVFLGGLDDRIRACCCAGMMTTWRDYLLYKCHAHTWMIYVPGLPLELDYPEILGLRAPLPSLVQNCADDPLFTLSEMRRADGILKDVYRRAGVSDRYHCSFQPGGHRFDRAMQEEAFAWFDRWLKT